MLLPTKRLPVERSLIVVGSRILRLLDEPKTVSRVWEEMNRPRPEYDNSTQLTFDWFVLGLDFLYAIQAIDIDQGRIRRMNVS